MYKKKYIFFFFLLFIFVRDLCAVAGVLDTTFNAAGVIPGTLLTTVINRPSEAAEGVAIQADGKIIMVGNVAIVGGTSFAIARLNTDGSLDTTFNSTGVQPGTNATSINGISTSNLGKAVAIQTDGKIIVAGSTNTGLGGLNFALARFNVDGSLDTSFNSLGVQPGTVATPITGQGADSSAQAVAIQDDGKIVAVGIVDTRFAVARFNIDGTLDTTFNPSGSPAGTLSSTIDGQASSQGEAVVIQKDGKIVAAGIVTDAFSKIAVARFNSDGSLDTSFNAAGLQPGTVSTTVDNETIANEGYGVALTQGGQIVVAGSVAYDAGPNLFAVVQFNTDGTIDETFNASGIQPGTIGIAVDNFFGSAANAVAIQPGGRIVAAGVLATTPQKFALARLLPNGVLDTTFNPNGINPGTVSTLIANATSLAKADGVAIQQDGKIVAVGSARVALNFRFAAARFEGGLEGINACNFRIIEKYGPRLY